MNAIVESGGKQYRVAPGDVIRVEKLSFEAGTDVTLDRVLLVTKDGTVTVGSPYVEGAKVLASVEKTGKLPKVVIHKQKPRKVYRKTNGHRQPFTSLRIKEILFGG